MQRSLFFVLAFVGFFGFAQAQNLESFPVKPIKVIVPFPPGGGADTLIRLMAPSLTELWKQSLIIENRPGAGESSGSAYVAPT